MVTNLHSANDRHRKTLEPIIFAEPKTLQEIKMPPVDNRTLARTESTSQSTKAIPGVQNASQNPKHTRETVAEPGFFLGGRAPLRNGVTD